MNADFQQLQNLIYSSCIALDTDDYAGYMGLFSEEMRYTVTAYSPDLRKEMTWLDHDRTEMSHLFKMLPQHVRLDGDFFRQASVYRLEAKGDGWEAITSLLLLYTDLAGSSRLMAAGRYHDTIVDGASGPVIKERLVRLASRDLGPGIHVPI